MFHRGTGMVYFQMIGSRKKDVKCELYQLYVQSKNNIFTRRGGKTRISSYPNRNRETVLLHHAITFLLVCQKQQPLIEETHSFGLVGDTTAADLRMVVFKL